MWLFIVAPLAGGAVAAGLDYVVFGGALPAGQPVQEPGPDASAH